MKRLCDRYLCTGCGACFAKCPKQCISFIEDNHGFAYPEINEKDCIKCGICAKVCPVQNQHVMTRPTFIYKTHSQSKRIDIMKSSSGGTVSEIVRYFLKYEGSVYSSFFDENYNLTLNEIVDESNIINLQGSKYVQGRAEHSYKLVLNQLQKGKKVLYIGTPCQIAGLYSFLGGRNPSLWTIDLLCAGVASPGVFRRFVTFLKLKYGNFCNLNFRNKKYGYGFYVTSISKDDSKERVLTDEAVSFSKCIGKGFVRKSCFACQYHNIARIGDITVGDYGRKNLTRNELKYGVNLCFVNTENGKKLFDALRNNLSFQEISYGFIKEKLESTPLSDKRKHNFPSNYESFFTYAMENEWEKTHELFIKERTVISKLKQFIPLKLYYYLLAKRQQ